MTTEYERNRSNLMNQLLQALQTQHIPDCALARQQAALLEVQARTLRGNIPDVAPLRHRLAGDSLIEAAVTVAQLVEHMCEGRDRAQLLTDIKVARLQLMVSDLQWQVGTFHPG